MSGLVRVFILPVMHRCCFVMTGLCLHILKTCRQQVARLPEYVSPIFCVKRFSLVPWLFQLLSAFLGVHLRALVFYSDGEIVSRQHFQYIGAFPESESAYGL